MNERFELVLRGLSSELFQFFCDPLSEADVSSPPVPSLVPT